MSLLRLLTAGKSLVGIRDNPSRYVTRRGMLPKFGSKRNPFRATAMPDSRNTSDSSQPAQELKPQFDPPPMPLESAGQVPPTSNVEGIPAAIQPATVSESTPREVKGSGGAKVERAASRMDMSFDWSKMLFWRRPKPVRQAVPRFSKPMVQGELSLEGVRVVRNDLSDSDLEIIRVAPAPVVQPAAAPVGRDQSESAWGRVTGRLFGAGKT